MRSGHQLLLVAIAAVGCSQRADKGTQAGPDGSVNRDSSTLTPDAPVDTPVDSGPACSDADSRSISLASAARTCSADHDCSIVYSRSCCGGDARGIGTAQAATYSKCLNGGGCQIAGAECFSYAFTTDRSQVTSWANGGGPADPNYLPTVERGVTVACVQGLCTTDFAPADAGPPR